MISFNLAFFENSIFDLNACYSQLNWSLLMLNFVSRQGKEAGKMLFDKQHLRQSM